MRYREAIKEEARLDIAEAMAWYAVKSPGLDSRFFHEFELAVIRILLNPFAYKQVYKEFRQTSIHKFPYVIVYELSGNTVVVYAVFNTWQNPKKKFKRIKPI